MILKQKEKVDDRNCDSEIKHNKYLSICESFKHVIENLKQKPKGTLK